MSRLCPRQNSNLHSLDTKPALFPLELQHLGPKPFHLQAGLNVAAFDAVFTVIRQHLAEIPDDLSERFAELGFDEDFEALTRSATTDEEVVNRRLELARERLINRLMKFPRSDAALVACRNHLDDTGSLDLNRP